MLRILTNIISITERVWQALRDSRVRNQYLASGDMSFRWKADSPGLTIHCRCVSLPVIPAGQDHSTSEPPLLMSPPHDSGNYHRFSPVDDFRSENQIFGTRTVEIAHETLERLDLVNIGRADDFVPIMQKHIADTEEKLDRIYELFLRTLAYRDQIQQRLYTSNPYDRGSTAIHNEFLEAERRVIDLHLRLLESGDIRESFNEIVYTWLANNGTKLNIDDFRVQVIFDPNISDDLRAKANRALDRFADWWAKNMDEWPENGHLTIEFSEIYGDRGFYSVVHKKIGIGIPNLDNAPEDDLVRTLIHESGHALEQQVFREKGKTWASDFLYSRTENKIIRRFEGDHRHSEYYLEDRFIHDYMGKLYEHRVRWDMLQRSEWFQVSPWQIEQLIDLWGTNWRNILPSNYEVLGLSGTEITSMGLSQLYENPLELLQEDSEMFILIVNRSRFDRILP